MARYAYKQIFLNPHLNEDLLSDERLPRPVVHLLSIPPVLTLDPLLNTDSKTFVCIDIMSCHGINKKIGLSFCSALEYSNIRTTLALDSVGFNPQEEAKGEDIFRR
jgi:hypothetical protein